jgi:hypothetical protein
MLNTLASPAYYLSYSEIAKPNFAAARFKAIASAFELESP